LFILTLTNDSLEWVKTFLALSKRQPKNDPLRQLNFDPLVI